MTKEISEKSPSKMAIQKKIFFGKNGKVDKDALVKEYMPFVQGIARKVKKTLCPEIDTDDLISYGLAGLLEAADRYDIKYGAHFTTFSYYRVRGAIYDGLRGMGWVSRTEYQKIRFEERATAYLENAALSNMSGQPRTKSTEEKVADLASKVENLVTIYVTSLEGMGGVDVVDDALESQENKLEKEQLKEQVKAAITQLPEKDKRLISLYYFEEKSLEEVGKEIGLSKSWTCRKHAQIIEKLGKIMKSTGGEKASMLKKQRNQGLGDNRIAQNRYA